ncbi:MAG: iron-containing redox enzyme family protein [Myxococcota bacterium]|nr:iron-containing redox enzyme family protein [Myxococcota bacterium]
MKKLLIECVEALGAATDRFPWEQRAAYADWLAQTYYYVRHTTRLIATAMARFPLDERGTSLHHRFAAHLGEEKKHEQLALHDLKHVGASITELPEHPSTRMFYESQYYKIEHLGPVVHFGYILPLEGIGPASGKRITDRAAAAHGAKCVSFLRLHAKDDVEPLEKALAIVAGVAPTERALIEDNMRQTTHGYCTMLLDIRSRLQDSSSRAETAAPAWSPS